MKKLAALLLILVASLAVVADDPAPQLTIAESIRVGKSPSERVRPSDIAEITRGFDSLAASIGFERAYAGVMKEQGLTNDEMLVLIVWMAEVRPANNVTGYPGPLSVKEIRDHHITCMRNLRKCSDSFAASDQR